MHISKPLRHEKAKLCGGYGVRIQVFENCLVYFEVKFIRLNRHLQYQMMRQDIFICQRECQIIWKSVPFHDLFQRIHLCCVLLLRWKAHYCCQVVQVFSMRHELILNDQIEQSFYPSLWKIE